MFALIGELTERIFSSSPPEGFREDPRRERKKKKMKCRSFATLLFKDHDELKDDLNPTDRLSIFAYELRSRRMFDSANHLEFLTDEVLNEDNTNVEKVLSLLTHLADISTVSSSSSSELLLLPKSLSQDPLYVLLPVGPLKYGDTRFPDYRRQYTTYSEELFKKPILERALETRHSFFVPRDNLLHMNPGDGLKFFTAPNKNRSEILNIPELRHTLISGERLLRIPRKKMSEITYNINDKDDDGYHSPPPAEEEEAAEEGELTDNVWDEIWKVKVPKRRTWERLGNLSSPKEKSYLSESSEGLHRAWLVAMGNLRLIDERISIPELSIVTEKELVVDIGYVMIGVASRTFIYENKRFRIRKGLTVNGLTPETLESFANMFMECGNYCRALEDFTSSINNENGLIYKGFLKGLRNYLSTYRIFVMKIVSNQRLLQLYKTCYPLSKQIQFLAQLCGPVVPPRGVQLLCYLLDKTLHINTVDIYFILVSILRSSAEPYFRFLERWMFHGLCYDEYCEFGLIVGPPGILLLRDRRYWTQAYTLAELPRDSSICGGGNFVSDVQNQVYNVGKSLNLLKMCCPTNHLCSERRRPSIKLLVTPKEEALLKREYFEYVQRMESLTEEKTVSLLKQKRLMELEKSEILKLAREKHRENIERIRKEQLEIRQAADLKKRKIFQDLKEQAMEEIKRKAEEKLKRAKEDKEWIEKAEKVDAEAVEREQKAKEEIQDYYRGLSQEAEARERKAEWRFNRNKLREKRIEFWAQEKSNIENELKKEEERKKNEVKSSIKVTEDEMKNIVLTYEDQESNIVVLDGDVDIPQDILSVSVNQSFETLPTWVQSKLLTKVHDDLEKSSTKKKPDPHPFFFDEYDNNDEEEDVYIPNLNEIATVDGRKRPTSKPIEEVLYPGRSKVEEIKEEPRAETEFKTTKSVTVVPYDKSSQDAIPKMSDFSERLIPKPAVEKAEISEAFTPLMMLMENSILIPLRAQMGLVNKAILNYILVEAGLMNHFRALRDYLFFHNGEFGHHLSYSLFKEISECKNPAHLLNPATLNRIVDNASMSSTFGPTDKYASNVGFSRNRPLVNGDILGCLELTYRTEWPTNIILTQETLEKYGQIFRFLMQLKKAVWGLEQVFFELKKISCSRVSHHYHQIHLMRHEMINFVSVAQGYVSTQVLDVSWAEFQIELEEKIDSLDSLYESHIRYLNKALFRCLLNKKAKPVQKIISDIFNVIVKFSLILTSVSWIPSLSGELVHPSFRQLEDSYKLFKEYSSFLYQVVAKLAARGYEHHLHDLMLRLNFNGFYQKI